MELRTIKNVPIVSTGTYPLGSGETTFTADDLASAVLAANDPTVVAPRIKIGHTDQRFESDPSLDGNPAMGTVQNMTLTDDGQTIVGDLTDVPAWLADSMASAYPGRSIEGGFGFTAPSGHDYKLAISHLALLGETWPGVTSLADLRDLMQRNGPVTEAAASGDHFTLAGGKAKSLVSASVGNRTADERRTMASKGEAMSDGSFPIGAVTELESAIRLARTPEQRSFVERRARALNATDKIPESWKGGTKAALDLGALPRRFAADLVAGRVPKLGNADQAKWWPRSVQAADDGKLTILVDTDAGQLLTLPFTVDGDEVAYGSPVPVAASTGALSAENLKGPRVLASWPSHTAAGPRKEVMRINADIDRAKLVQRLGLPEDATDAAINDALGVENAGAATDAGQAAQQGEASQAQPGEAGQSGEPGGQPGQAQPPAQPGGTGAAPGTQQTSASGRLPEGVVAIDASRLAELERGAQAGANVAASLERAERDKAITGAIKGGRIAASRREHFEQRWAVDRDGTRTLLTADPDKGGLAAVIPVDQIEAGFAGDGDGRNPEAGGPRLFPELESKEVAA